MRANSLRIADIYVRWFQVVGDDNGVFLLELLTPKAVAWAWERDFVLGLGGVFVAQTVVWEILENLDEKGLFYYAAEGLPGFVYTSR